ncbi:ATP-binding cassette domain-containing protein [Paenibacillus sp. MER TA 81-3]|uniref:ribosomal protection-like ABC-F family protein n=1 Tax=Paenibacillus sp. MER TA 81-3 TaxID=2939573 RepID=UPI00203C680E|nr:ABC-F family ATP-binding cassette domain-containing protein [Paenibacillus sp. MER TA 81-3]MCM3338966.1 ATP-binding cassette domain-containing protein [Paenibacillus sp. MER TA 81-3]
MNERYTTKTPEVSGRLVMEAHQLAAYVGDRRLFRLQDPLRVYAGERIGLIGANGVGKTTLLRMLAGILEPDAGYVKCDVSSSFVPQLDDVREEEAEEVTLSGGERTKRRLNEAANSGAELLLLDEPTSHLDVEGLEWLEERLIDYARNGTLLFISHDRTLLNRVATKIWEVENEAVHIYSGGYEDYRREKERLRTERQRAYENYVAERQRLQEAIVEKKTHAHKVGKPRPKKGLTSKEIRSARPHFNRKQSKVEKTVKAMEKRLEQLKVVEQPFELAPVLFDANCHAPLRSKSALEAQGLRLSVEDRELVRDGAFRIRPHMRVALIGPNGAGKTTLLRRLLEAYEAHGQDTERHAEGTGVIRYAPSARIAYYDQKLYALNLQESVLDNVLKSSAYDQTSVRTTLARLRLRRDDALKPVWQLSGGEKVKTQLAKMFMSEANVLLLDEPTNYLDIDTREELERVLKAYPGTLVFATHDRTLMDRTATHAIVFNNGTLDWLTIEALRERLRLNANGERSPAAASAAEVQSDSVLSLSAEERMKLELEWAELLARLSAPRKDDAVEELERRYAELLERRRQL